MTGSSLAPPPAPPRAVRVRPGDARLIAPIVAAVGLALWPASDDGVTICPVRNCTGAACPGCGLTRGLAALFRGDWATSWFYHPASLFIAVQAAAVWGFVVARRTGVIRAAAPRWVVPVLLVVNGMALTALWLVRWRLGHLERVI